MPKDELSKILLFPFIKVSTALFWNVPGF